MPFLIDTDILIYSLKNNEKVNENFKKFAEEPKAVSVITYGELVFGARKSKNVQKNSAMVNRLCELFPVIPVTKDIMNIFGEIKAGLQVKGKSIDDMDLIIAATAINWNYTLITNNESHFKRIPGLMMENWNK